jgi:hypothetical protein
MKEELMVRKESTKRLSKVSKTLTAGWSIPQAKAATATPLAYVHTGIAYVYSNNPENIGPTDKIPWTPVPVTGAFTIEKKLTAGSLYDVEFYHCMKVARMEVGIAIQNRGSSTATITVSAKATRSDGGRDSATLVETDYQNGKGSTTMTVVPNGAQWVLLIDNLAVNNYVVGKVKLKSDVADVWIRVIYGPAGVPASTVMSYPQTTHYIMPGLGNYSGTTTGYFTHDALTTSVDFSQGQSLFVLPGWSTDPQPPISEYEAALATPPPHGPCGPLENSNGVVLGGNYGMVYQITIAHASGKILKITPNSVSPAPGSGTIVVQTPDSSSWAKYSIDVGGSQTFPIKSAPWVLKFVQPGGNSSNFTFTII